MNRCRITFEELVDHFEGRLDSTQTERLRHHLTTGCKACDQQVAWLQQFLPALVRAVTDEVPQVSVEALSVAKNIARAYPREQKQPSLLVQIAQLIFDNRVPTLATAARNIVTGEFQLVYSAQDKDIDLWMERQEHGNWYLIGQVLPKNGSEAITPQQVLLTSRDGRTYQAISQDGEFAVRSLPDGRYEVRLHLEDGEIVLPDVRV